MAPISKTTSPICNDQNVRALPITVSFTVTCPIRRNTVIATRTEVMQSWEDIFQLQHVQGAAAASQNLEDSAVSMKKGNHPFKAYFARVFADRGSGGHKSRIVNQKETLSIIAKHRAAWDQTLSTNSVHREDDASEDLVVARAIYSMYNSIPRDTDNATGKHKLKYYDNSNEVMLWAVLHSFIKFLNRLTTKHGALDTTVGA